MAAAQTVAKGSVVSPCGNRAAPGFLGRRRGAVAARMAPSAVRIGGSWRKTAFPGGRVALGTRRSRPASRSLFASPAQVNIDSGVLVIMRSFHVYRYFFLRSFCDQFSFHTFLKSILIFFSLGLLLVVSSPFDHPKIKSLIRELLFRNKKENVKIFTNMI